MKKTIIFLFLPALCFLGLLLFINQGSAKAEKPAAVLVSTAAAKVAGPAAVPSPAFAWRKETNNAFPSNEKLSFEVAWGFLVVGYASMDVAGIENVSGRSAYHIVTQARSAPFFDVFYKVRNTNESWIDTESLCSLKYSAVSDEKDNMKTETELFDQANHTFLILGKDKSGTTPAWVQDVLSSLYYIRTKDLSEGQEFVLDTQSGDTAWPLKVKVVKKEKISVPAGSFECFVVEPSIREGAGIFQAKGKLWVWLTADSRKLPVQMRSKIAVGSIEARLKSVE